MISNSNQQARILKRGIKAVYYIYIYHLLVNVVSKYQWTDSTIREKEIIERIGEP